LRAAIESLIALIAHPVAVLDRSGAVTLHNTEFGRIIRTAPDAITGAAFGDLLPAKMRPALAEFLTSAETGADPDARLLTRVQDPLGLQTRLCIAPLRKSGPAFAFLCQGLTAPPADDPRMRYVMEHLEHGVWDYDIRTKFFVVSEAWRRMRGLAPGDRIDVSNDEWLLDVHPDDRQRLREVFEGQTRGQTRSIVIQYRRRHTAGHWVWILCRASVMQVDDRGRPLRIVGTDTEITELKESESDLLKLTGKLQLAIEASGMGIWEFDPATSQVHWDDRMLEIYGISDGQNIRSENLWETYLHPDDLADTVAYADACQALDADFKRDYRIVRPDGKVRHIRSLARSVSGPGVESKLIGVNIDVTEDYLRAQELEHARRQLEHDSRHDPLTGLGNRRGLDEATAALFSRVAAGDRYAVMHLDLDHFKQVNDTLGHSAGDFVLCHVAATLRQVIGDAGLPFRVGGDEFAVLFEVAPSEQTLADMSEALIERLGRPLDYQGQQCSFGASIGYALGAGPPVNPSDVFIMADTALYSAKHAGRSCYRAYSPEVEAIVSQSANTRQDLIEALANDEIICHYQPQFDARSLEIVGAEALVRWQCPSRGLLTPDKFLPQALDAGLIPEIDEHVLRIVARQQDLWARAGVPFPTVSLNTSRARLKEDTLIEHLRDILKPHHRIAFELLETAFLDKLDSALAFKLDTLRDMGIRIELDDFGSGHSSVAALQAVRPDRVKIDRSLVEPIARRPTQILTLRSLARIARLEAAQIVVEGLETGIQLAAIRELDCDVLQGYALQRPMPAIELAALLTRTASAASAG